MSTAPEATTTKVPILPPKWPSVPPGMTPHPLNIPGAAERLAAAERYYASGPHHQHRHTIRVSSTQGSVSNPNPSSAEEAAQVVAKLIREREQAADGTSGPVPPTQIVITTTHEPQPVS